MLIRVTSTTIRTRSDWHYRWHFYDKCRELDTNLGELTGANYQQGSILLAQGFLQPAPMITTALENNYQGIEFSYYPNPTSVSFQLQSDIASKINRVIFYNMNGQLVKTTPFTSTTLDVASLPKGLYLVQALDQDGISIHAFKLLKQ